MIAKVEAATRLYEILPNKNWLFLGQMKFFIFFDHKFWRIEMGSKKYPAGCFDSVESNIDCALFRFAVGRGWRCWAATFIRLHLLLICCNQVGGTLTSIHFLYNSQLETFYVLRDWIYQRWMKLYEYIAGKNIKMSLQSFLRLKSRLLTQNFL